MSFFDIFRVNEYKQQNENLQQVIENMTDNYSMLTHELNYVRESMDREIRTRGYGWQSLADIKGTNTDFTLEKHQEMQEKVREAFFFSPAAKRFVTYSTSYITGKDFAITSNIPELQKIIDSIVKDQFNDFNRQKREWTQRFLIDGEVFITLHLGQNGSVKLRETDPFEIKSVIRNPEDDQDPILYKRTYFPMIVVDGCEQAGTMEKTEYILDIRKSESDLKLLNLPADIKPLISKTKRIQHVKTLSFSNRTRGFSPLLNILYYLQRIREDIDQKVKLKKCVGSYYLDVKVKGGTNDVAAIANQQQYKRPPKPGSVLVHNESVEHSILDPKVDHDNDNKSIEPILQQIVIGTGMPEWMLVGQANMFKAGAQEQSGPFVKVIEDLQELFGDEYLRLFTFIIKYKLDRNQDRLLLENTNTKKAKLSFIDKNYEIFEPMMNENGDIVNSTIKKPFWAFIDVNFPVIIVRDDEKEAKAITQDLANGLVSKKTASIKRGYDYDNEKIMMDKESEEDKAKNPLLNGDMDIDQHEDDNSDDGEE